MSLNVVKWDQTSHYCHQGHFRHFTSRKLQPAYLKARQPNNKSEKLSRSVYSQKALQHSRKPLFRKAQPKQTGPIAVLGPAPLLSVFRVHAAVSPCPNWLSPEAAASASVPSIYVFGRMHRRWTLPAVLSWCWPPHAALRDACLVPCVVSP